LAANDSSQVSQLKTFVSFFFSRVWEAVEAIAALERRRYSMTVLLGAVRKRRVGSAISRIDCDVWDRILDRAFSPGANLGLLEVNCPCPSLAHSSITDWHADPRPASPGCSRRGGAGAARRSSEPSASGEFGPCSGGSWSRRSRSGSAGGGASTWASRSVRAGAKLAQ
jgi:hypothetical protein